MAGEKKKRPGKRDYLNDYYTDAAGKVIYTGALYRYADGQPPRQKMLAKLWALGGGAAAAMVAVGCVPAGSTSNSFYVLLPFLAGAVTAVSVIYGLALLTKSGDPLKAHTYQRTVGALPGRAMGLAALAGITAGMELVYLAGNRGGPRPGWDLALLLLTLLAGAGALALRRTLADLHWEKADK